MDYVRGLEFEQHADFNMLKSLVRDMANEAQIDLFDNVFDWSLKLVQQHHPELNKQGVLEFAQNFKFNDFAEVTKIILQAYQNNPNHKKKMLNNNQNNKLAAKLSAVPLKVLNPRRHNKEAQKLIKVRNTDNQEENQVEEEKKDRVVTEKDQCDFQR